MQRLTELKQQLEASLQRVIESARGDRKRSAESAAELKTTSESEQDDKGDRKKSVEVAIACTPVFQDTARTGRQVQQQIIGAYPHGSNWTTLIKNPSDTPFWVLHNFNRQYCFEKAPGSPAVFLRTTANHLTLGAPTPKGTLHILRYNLFKHRVVIQCTVTDNEVPELLTAPPLLLPSGRYHVPGEIFCVQQWQNLIECNVQIRLLPELLKTIPESTVASSGSRGEQVAQQAQHAQADPELPKLLEITTYAGDGVWNYDQYTSDAITHFHLTALAEFVVVEPNHECIFDILPQRADGTPRPLFDPPTQPAFAAPVPPPLPRFNGITQLPLTFNPTMHANIHGIVESVEDFEDDRLFLNHRDAGRVWLLVVNVQGARIEMLCLRHNVSHQKQKTAAQNTPTYEDTVTPPRPGDRIYARAWIQAYSAHDMRNRPFLSNNEPRKFYNAFGGPVAAGFDYSSNKAEDRPAPGISVSILQQQGKVLAEADRQERKRAEEVTQQETKTTAEVVPAVVPIDPDRYFFHSGHIINQILQADFAQPVLARINPENFGSLYRFFPIARPARLAGIEGPGFSPLAQEVIKRSKEPIVFKLYDPSPPCKALLEPYNPRLLGVHSSNDYRKPFSHQILEFLTLKEAMFVSRVCKETHQLIYDDSHFWAKRFKTLSLGSHIYVSEVDDLSHIQRWVKVLYSQRTLAYNKRKLDLDLVTAKVLPDPIKDEMIAAVTAEFRLRTHQCGYCITDVSYALRLDTNHRYITDFVQMACVDCFNSKLWDKKQVSVLWDVPRNRLKDVSCWRLPTLDWYSTPDLTDNFIKFHARLLKPLAFKTRDIADNFKKLLAHLNNTNELQKDMLNEFEKIIKEYDEINSNREQYLNTQRIEDITEEMALRHKDLPSIVRSIVGCEFGEIPTDEMDDAAAFSQALEAAASVAQSEGERKASADAPSFSGLLRVEGLIPSFEQSLLPKTQKGYFLTYKKKGYPPQEFQDTKTSKEARRLQETIQKNTEADTSVIERITSPLANSKNAEVIRLLDTIHADMQAAGEPGLRAYANARVMEQASTLVGVRTKDAAELRKNTENILFESAEEHMKAQPRPKFSAEGDTKSNVTAEVQSADEVFEMQSLGLEPNPERKKTAEQMAAKDLKRKRAEEVTQQERKTTAEAGPVVEPAGGGPGNDDSDRLALEQRPPQDSQGAPVAILSQFASNLLKSIIHKPSRTGAAAENAVQDLTPVASRSRAGT